MAKMIPITVSIEESAKDEIEAVASKKGLTANLLIRTIVYEWLEQQKQLDAA